ncbi:MAG: hypothetical protein IT291_05135 [Deltaproteobacteria bacterium]|nr:hypothetical protein [Deltaproteobacteria bacterium]
MIGVYVLTTILSYFFPVFPALANSEPVEVAVSFDDLNGLGEGAKVLADGQWVGVVSDVLHSESDAEIGAVNSNGDSGDEIQVSVKINPLYRDVLKRGTVGLIMSQVSVFKDSPETVVELIVPKSSKQNKALAKGEVIKGYSSYLDFWAAS